MKFGYFDDQEKEYIITQPDTPLPWINYLGCEDYFCLISNTAGGFSFYKDARFRRITRYRYNNVPTDFGGRYIYIRDNTSAEYWSPTWQPTKTQLDEYRCRHGLSYSIISSLFKKVFSKIVYFVPLGDNLEIWNMEIKNNRNIPIDISIFSCIEFCLWDALDDATNFQRNFNIGEVEVEDNTIYHKTGYRERRNHFAFFSTSHDIKGFETQREKFLGAYRDWKNPIVVERGKTLNSLAKGWSPIGSHQINLTIDANESKRVIFLLGYYENKQGEKFFPPGSEKVNKKLVKKVIDYYLDENNVNKAFNNLKEKWSILLEKFQVKCPDIHTNRMVNIWNPYQCMINYNLARSASYFESGISRGIGFRDSNQDLLGFIHLAPDLARDRIINLASTQLKTGGAYHQYQPLTKEGNEQIGTDFNDDPLWLILSVSMYIKETGDLGILDELVPYGNKNGTEETLLEHLKRSIFYIENRIGPHGLPLIGRADWNDCLNLNHFSMNPDEPFQTIANLNVKNAESIFIAALYIIALKEICNILLILGMNEKALVYLDQVNKMESRILNFGWDGKWFIRAYDRNGNKIGSEKSHEGKIYIESQAFCVMAGVGLKEGLAKKALNSVKKYLDTKHGIMLLQPPYSNYDVKLGEISSYPPGYKENGSIFCHTNPWIIIAETLIGRGDQAFHYYLKINPSKREEISEIHRCEPYVYCQTIAGKDAETFGEGKNSWLTGSAAWNYIAITQGILGIHPTYNGLIISPIIPKTWSKLSVTRMFRKVKYKVKITRLGEGNKITIYVNDVLIKGNLVPLPESKQEVVNVNVEIS